jgi:hypothetical protein
VLEAIFWHKIPFVKVSCSSFSFKPKATNSAPVDLGYKFKKYLPHQQVHGEEITIMVRSILNINFKNIIFRRNV